MTHEEIRHHALAIAEMRRSNRSKAERRRNDRGYDTVRDFKQDFVRPLNHLNMAHGSDAVDRMFRLHERFGGLLPRGSWS